MSQHWKLLLPALLSVLIASQPIRALAQESFPTYRFNALIGATESSESNAGVPVVMNFWFTTCPGCIEEMEKLNALAAEYKGAKIRFIAPTFDPKELVEAFLAEHQFAYSVVGFGDQDPSVYFKDGKIIFPMHVVLDGNGLLVYRAVGDVNIDELRAAINSAIK